MLEHLGGCSLECDDGPAHCKLQPLSDGAFGTLHGVDAGCLYRRLLWDPFILWAPLVAGTLEQPLHEWWCTWNHHAAVKSQVAGMPGSRL